MSDSTHNGSLPLDALLTMDHLDAINVGDEVQLMIYDDIPVTGRYGMREEYHGQWMRVEGRFPYDDADSESKYIYRVSDPTISYSTTVRNIMGWRPKR